VVRFGKRAIIQLSKAVKTDELPINLQITNLNVRTPDQFPDCTISV
jgi:hypothetical protein